MRPKQTACIGLIVVALLIRLGAAIFWHHSISSPTYLIFGDSDTYWYLSKTIALGEDYQYGSPNSKIFRAPLYPAVLAPAAWLLPEGERYDWFAILVARFIGCALGTLGVILVFYVAIHVGSPPLVRAATQASHQSSSRFVGGLCAGLLAAFYPGAVGMSIFVLSEALFCPLMIASLYFTHRSIPHAFTGNRQNSWVHSGIAGFFSGLCCLTRPSWSLWPALLFPFLFFASNRKFNNRFPNWIAQCAFFCLGICLAMAPWWIRNYSVTGKFVPTTLQVGASPYDGWHQGASGASDENMEFVLAFAEEQAKADQRMADSHQMLESTFEWRLNQRLLNAAIQWASENSSDVIRLGLIKLSKTWSPLPAAREIGGTWIKLSEAIGYSSILGLSAIGLWSTRRRPGAWLYSLPCFYFAILHAIFIGSVRYRQPAVLVLCVLGGVGLVQIWNWICRTPTIDKSSSASSSEPDASSLGHTE